MDTVNLYDVKVDVNDRTNPLRVFVYPVTRMTEKTIFVWISNYEKRFSKEREGLVKRNRFFYNSFEFFTTDENMIDRIVEDAIALNRQRQVEQIERLQSTLHNLDSFDGEWQTLKREQERFKNGQ